MTTLPKYLEALMPEPSFRLKWIEPLAAYRVSKPNFGDAECYTATQMREAILAATERAAKKAFINALDDAYNAMFDLRGDKVTRFDAQTAIQKLKDAAAASTGRGEGGEGA